jgi:hypothetical protein
MKLSQRGESTLAAEVTNISGFGIWLLVRDREYFLPYDNFPWFLEQPVRAILNVEEPRPGYLHWPDLDIDLSLDIIERPEDYPEVARSRQPA